MRASILDLRRNMRQILAAIDHNESVILTYRGSEKATIVPKEQVRKIDIKKHPAFGIWADKKDNVSAVVRNMRKGRFDAL
ncbi:MAG: hypothetical protein LLF92_06520 [Planctomycetaceae bacterium]|nr:hypothetical protein [Planctomycetaceae bacterium]